MALLLDRSAGGALCALALLVLVFAPATGCSALLLDRAPSDYRPADDGPPHCTPSVTAPVVDTVLAVGSAGLGLVAMFPQDQAVQSTSEGVRYLAMGAGFTLSAIGGYGATGECRRAQGEFEDFRARAERTPARPAEATPSALPTPPSIRDVDVEIAADAPPVGALGGPCTEGGACDEGLVCDEARHQCREGSAAPVGAAGGPCTPGGACDPGLTCDPQDDTCRPHDGD